MAGFFQLLKQNRNYRYMWTGQIVSEIGDHFNNIAVFSLALADTKSGMVVTGIMLSRAIPAVMAGPLAGVVLDRLDRKRVMMSSDLIRAIMALGFILTLDHKNTSLLYVFSALLMLASPFFTSGRSSILPVIANREEIHTANSVSQTTGWMTLTIGTLLGGTSVMQFGYEWAFVFNSLSFLVSAACISRLRVPSGHFRAERKDLTEAEVVRPWHRARHRRVGERWRSGADSLQPLRRSRFPSRCRWHWNHLGLCGNRPVDRRRDRPRAWEEHLVLHLQANDFCVLLDPRLRLRDLQPNANLRLGAVLHRAF